MAQRPEAQGPKVMAHTHPTWLVTTQGRRGAKVQLRNTPARAPPHVLRGGGRPPGLPAPGRPALASRHPGTDGLLTACPGALEAQESETGCSHARCIVGRALKSRLIMCPSASPQPICRSSQRTAVKPRELQSRGSCPPHPPPHPPPLPLPPPPQTAACALPCPPDCV